MNIIEATKRACEEPTLIKALTFICIWESKRVVRQARENEQWETCFGFSIKSVMDAYCCSHELISIKNEVIKDGFMCVKCGELFAEAG